MEFYRLDLGNLRWEKYVKNKDLNQITVKKGDPDEEMSNRKSKQIRGDCKMQTQLHSGMD